MYLQQLFLHNSGPTRRLALDLPFEGDRPIPLVLVGANGSGKTNLLSIVADALFEAAVGGFEDIIAGATPVSHKWFRVIGDATVSTGAQNGFSVLRFSHGGQPLYYYEKAGVLDPQEARAMLPSGLQAGAEWDPKESSKGFKISREQARNIFQAGAYVYFPSSRSEFPHWLNRESLSQDKFDITERFNSRLGKPLFVEQGIAQFKQWILNLLLESRYELKAHPTPEGGWKFDLQDTAGVSLGTSQTLEIANKLLQIVLGSSEYRFAWSGRHSSLKVIILSADGEMIPGLEALSSGQSTLLNVFGTLLRYADAYTGKAILSTADIEGICLVDEIDAHMHIDLQMRALPQLVSLFPQVQFILSSHSPLFVLGMEQTFSPDHVRILQLPEARFINAEAYVEFDAALNAFKQTKAFGDAVINRAGQSGPILVLVEGETDPTYLKAAAEILNRGELLNKISIEWVGAKTPSGQVLNTGKSALNQTLAILKANPDLTARRVVLLYDFDAQKSAEDHGQLHVRGLPHNPANTIADRGIENLLPADVFSEDMYARNEHPKPYGGKNITIELDKVRLATHLCSIKRDPEDFRGFLPVLDMLEDLVDATSSQLSVPE